MDSVSDLKNQIQQLRASKGPRAKIPSDIWSKISHISQSLPLKELCREVGINPVYARKKMSKSSSPIHKAFIQLPSSPMPLLELTLKSGAVIKVFEQ